MSVRRKCRSCWIVLCLFSSLALSSTVVLSQGKLSEKGADEAVPVEKVPVKEHNKSTSKTGDKSSDQSPGKSTGKPTGKPTDKRVDKTGAKEQSPADRAKAELDRKKPVDGDLNGQESSKEKGKGQSKQKAPENHAEKRVEKSVNKTVTKSGDKPALRPFEFTTENETRALEFAAQHHPELVVLISPLKTSNPKEYQKAIRELFRTCERLESVHVRDQRRYELELEAWKLNSQVRLLAARLVMSSDVELEEQLKAAIQKKAGNRIRMLQFEKESLQDRLTQIDKDLDKSKSTLEQVVKQEFERLLKQSNRDKAGLSKEKKGKKE